MGVDGMILIGITLLFSLESIAFFKTLGREFLRKRRKFRKCPLSSITKFPDTQACFVEWLFMSFENVLLLRMTDKFDILETTKNLPQNCCRKIVP